MNIRNEFEQFLISRRATNRATRTIDWYRQQVGCWVGYIESLQLTETGDIFDPDLFERYIEYERTRAGLSDSGVHARFRSARAFFKWLHQRERRRLRKAGSVDWEPPTDYIDAPSEPETHPRVADSDVVDRCIAGIRKRTWVDLRDRCFIEALRSCGLRVTEACNLRVQDVDLTDRFVLVRAGKGEKDRYVPFGDRFESAFLEYRFNRPLVDTELLFLAANGHLRATGVGLIANAVRQMVRRRCKVAGVAYFNPHSVRHLYAIDALNRGMKLDALSMAMGHSSSSFTLKRYARWKKSGLRSEYDTHINR